MYMNFFVYYPLFPYEEIPCTGMVGENRRAPIELFFRTVSFRISTMNTRIV